MEQSCSQKFSAAVNTQNDLCEIVVERWTKSTFVLAKIGESSLIYRTFLPGYNTYSIELCRSMSIDSLPSGSRINVIRKASLHRPN